MRQITILLGVTALLAVSCVPLRQYQDVKSQGEEDARELRRLENENEDLLVDNEELKSETKRLNNHIKNLEKDTLRLAKSNWQLRDRNNRLAKDYAELVEKYNGSSSGESGDLLAHLQSLHEELQKREDELLRAERALALKRQDLDDAKNRLALAEEELELRNKRLIELERILMQKDSAMNALKNAVSKALTDFGSDELSVYTKNGKVYVSMEEKLLFQSGSYQVSTQGQFAIKKIAKVLKNRPEIYVVVEGHTDNVPYKSPVLLDNWDLSVKRATSVVRIMIMGSNIGAERITAAGRSEFVPLEKANTTEARRKNRRTEIILAPNLDQIFNILDN